VPKKNTGLIIKLPPTALRKFKQRALRSKHEVLAFLVGSITKENDVITSITVEELYYPPQEAGRAYVSWNPNDVVRLQAQILPRAVIGTLHSHPGYEPHISRADIQTSGDFGDVISGIYSWWGGSNSTKRMTDLTFYYGVKILDYEA